MNEMKPFGIVTPDFQTQHMINAGLNLIKIYTDDDLMRKFKSHTFPYASITTDKEIFITPLRHVKISTDDYNTKWLVLDANFKPVHNHDYPMVPLPTNGYLMKIDYHYYNKNVAGNFTVDYLIDYNNLHVNIVTEKVGNNVIERYEFDKFNPLEYADKIDHFNDKVEFEKLYLYDIFDV